MLPKNEPEDYGPMTGRGSYAETEIEITEDGSILTESGVSRKLNKRETSEYMNNLLGGGIKYVEYCVSCATNYSLPRYNACADGERKTLYSCSICGKQLVVGGKINSESHILKLVINCVRYEKNIQSDPYLNDEQKESIMRLLRNNTRTTVQELIRLI